MDNLPYLEDLKRALVQLGEVEEKLSVVSNQKTILREKIKAWMDMNNLREFETLDMSNNKLWRMSITDTSRRSADYDYLESILTPVQLQNAINITESEVFKCQSVKSSKNKRKTAPAIPKARI